MENNTLTFENLKHVMIDTETLGLTPGCIVRTVSLLEFNPLTGNTGRRQTWVINLQDSIKAGFKVEAGTLKWWMMKTDAARKAFVSTPEEETSLVSFVSEFVEWFKPYGSKVALWALQTDFDPAMIRPYLAYYYMHIMRNDDYSVPWNRKLIFEVRPFIEIYRSEHPEIQTPHNSMDDCLIQINAVTELIKTADEVMLEHGQSLLSELAKLDIYQLMVSGVRIANVQP